MPRSRKWWLIGLILMTELAGTASTRGDVAVGGIRGSVSDAEFGGPVPQAVVRLVEKLGGKVTGLGFVVELDFLKGREKLTGYDVFSLLHYDK